MTVERFDRPHPDGLTARPHLLIPWRKHLHIAGERASRLFASKAPAAVKSLRREVLSGPSDHPDAPATPAFFASPSPVAPACC